MELIKAKISNERRKKLTKKFGEYAKITADIENSWLVIGPELHADGEKLLIEQGSTNENIWGGGINLNNMEIDTTAVMNIRPSLNNNSMEILAPERREKFILVVKEIFDING